MMLLGSFFLFIAPGVRGSPPATWPSGPLGTAKKRLLDRHGRLLKRLLDLGRCHRDIPGRITKAAPCTGQDQVQFSEFFQHPTPRRNWPVFLAAPPRSWPASPERWHQRPGQAPEAGERIGPHQEPPPADLRWSTRSTHIACGFESSVLHTGSAFAPPLEQSLVVPASILRLCPAATVEATNRAKHVRVPVPRFAWHRFWIMDADICHHTA